jgi:anti-sigma factor RsiW
MSNNQRQPDAWEPCPAGELAGMVDRQRRRRRASTIKAMGSAAAALVFCVFVGYLAATQLGEHHYGGLACSEVRPLLADYHTGQLPGDLAGQVRTHLEQCGHCRTSYEKMTAAKATAMVARLDSYWPRGWMR